MPSSSSLRRNLVAFGLACLLPSLASAQPAAQGLDNDTTVQPQTLTGTFAARPVNDFVDSVGSATHLGRYETVYVTRFDEWKPLLLDLGIRHLRTALMLHPQAIRAGRELAAAGIRFDIATTPDGWAVPKGDDAKGLPAALLSGSRQNPAYIPAFLAHVKSHFIDATELIEGLNEPDTHLELARQWMEELHRLGRADPAFAHVKFLGSALSNPRINGVKAGDWTPVVDVANLHAYPGGRAPEVSIPEYLKALTSQYHGLPIYITETGYHNALNNPPNRHRPASREVEAVYLPRLFLEYFRLGIARSYDFKLLDDRTEEEAMKYSIPVLQEAHFGLIDINLKPKPAYYAVKNLLTILRDDSAAKVSPRALSYSLAGAPDLRHVLLQKSTGEFCLAVWRAATIWDPVARKDLPVENVPVTVKFEAPLKAVRIYHPTRSPEIAASLADVREIPLTLAGEVAILAFQAP